MKCQNCGEQLAVFSHYCENCGVKALTAQEWWKYIGVTAIAFFKKRIWLVAVLASALTLSVGLGIWRNAANSLDPTDYVLVQTRGFNGDGEIEVTIDYSALFEKVLGPVPDQSTAKGYEAYSSYCERAEALQEALRVSVDRTNGLQNGDFCIVKVKILDSEAFKKCGVNIKNDLYQRTMQIGTDSAPFDEPVEIDLFDFIELIFRGESGSGYVTPSTDAKEKEVSFASGKKITVKAYCYESFGSCACYISISDVNRSIGVDFYFNKKNALANGDSITVTFSESHLEGLKAFGLLAKTKTKDYTVIGLTETMTVE